MIIYFRHLMITLHEEERSCQKLPEYQERMIIESETTSLASDLQPLPDDSYQDQGQGPDSGNIEDQRQLKITFKNEAERKLEDSSLLELKLSKDGLDDRLLSRDHSEIFSFEKEEELKVEKWKLENGESSKPEAIVSPLTNKQNFSLRDLPDKPSEISGFETGSMATKRKHISPVMSHSPISKSPKGESSLIPSEADNSSDSGISGDLTEEMEFQNGQRVGSSTADKELFIQEITDTLDNDYFVSQVHKTFGGKISTCIKCLNCKTESIHKDVFTDINLAFQDSDQCNASSTIRKQPERFCKQKQGDVVADLKIEDMIANFLTSERLTGENKYECDRCGGKQDAERSIQILETPEHLILTQLRFYYDTSKGQRQKVFTNVEFGEELLFPTHRSGRVATTEGEVPSPSDTPGSMAATPLSDEDSLGRNDAEEVSPVAALANYDRYALYGVVVHSGFSSEGGHYYCYARNSSIASIPQATRDR